jgi:hypothetical protein
MGVNPIATSAEGANLGLPLREIDLDALPGQHDRGGQAGDSPADNQGLRHGGIPFVRCRQRR